MTDHRTRSIVGAGELVSGGRVGGTLRRVTSVQDVLALMRNGIPDDLVLYTEVGSVTNVAPLIAHVRAVLCTAGGPTSHIAIVSRGFGRTCVVGVSMVTDVREIDGCPVVIEDDGTIYVIKT
jgi:phosphohistidine swiveling domain-containing protein